MKLHETLVEELLKLIEINSGFKEQWKLRKMLSQIDLSVYEQQTGKQVLVSTKALQENKRQQQG